MKGRQISYSDDELAFIEARAKLPRTDLHRAFVDRFGRRDVTVDNIKSLCTRKGWKGGTTGRFAKGNVPINKGKKMPYNENSARTRFKKGHRGGKAAENYKPIGTERVSRDGYLERKVNDDMPLQSRWRAVHLIRWEDLHGPLPEGHCLKCIDGDKANTDPSNWIAIPRALLPRLNGGRLKRLSYDEAEPELKPVILATARLQHAAREARKNKAQADQSEQ